MVSNIVVGIDNRDTFRVISCNYEEDKETKGKLNWAFKCEMVNVANLKRALSNRVKFLNIGIDATGKINGISASLSRFDSKTSHHPVVIISQVQSMSGRLLGYKIGTFDGHVKTITLKDMIAYGNRIHKQGLIPVQNAIYVPEDTMTDKKAYFKSYPNMPFIIEVYDTGKNKHVEDKRVPLKSNGKTLVRASEIFDRDQMEQLKLAKQHRVDLRVIANPKLSANKMKILREAMERGINVKPFAFPEYKDICMMYYIDCLENGISIRQMLSPKYNEAQLFQLMLASELGLNIEKMCNPSLSADDMSEIRERLERQIWKDELVKKDGSWK